MDDEELYTITWYWDVMKEMKTRFVAGTVIFLLFLTGCNESKSNQVTADEIRIMKEQNNNQISRLESQINEIKTDRKQLDNRLSMLEQLVNHLPDLTHKQGYMKEVVEDREGSTFMIDYAVMVPNDGYSPNNFHIENEKEDYVQVKAHKDVQTYILEGAQLNDMSGEPLNNQLHQYKRLFNLYFIEDKLILAVEQYLP